MIISFLNQKGGCGKSTLAINIARYFVKKGHKTLLVDSDKQGSAIRWHEASNGNLIDMTSLYLKTIDKDIIKYKNMYDYIFIDGIPRVSLVTDSTISCSDLIIIPVQPSPYDIWSTEELLKSIESRQIITGHKLKAYLVVNRKIQNTNLARDIKTELEKLNFPTLKSSTSQRIAYATSVEKGSTVLDDEYIGSEACKEIEQMALEIEEIANGINRHE